MLSTENFVKKLIKTRSILAIFNVNKSRKNISKKINFESLIVAIFRLPAFAVTGEFVHFPPSPETSDKLKNYKTPFLPKILKISLKIGTQLQEK